MGKLALAVALFALFAIAVHSAPGAKVVFADADDEFADSSSSTGNRFASEHTLYLHLRPHFALHERNSSRLRTCSTSSTSVRRHEILTRRLLRHSFTQIAKNMTLCGQTHLDSALICVELARP